MDNSSKALLIVATILVTIIVVTLGIRIFKGSSDAPIKAVETGKAITDATKTIATSLVEDSITGSNPATIAASGSEEQTNTQQQEILKKPWIQNYDGTITDGVNNIKVGDIVKYGEKIGTLNLTTDSQIITDLATYSGNTYEENNTISQIKQEKDLSWEVLDVKDGKIRLISTTTTESTIALYGYNGYNNAVYLLDEVCDVLYSKNGIGKAQNLKIEDIEEKIDKSKFDYTQFENNYVDTGKYGGTKEYTVTNPLLTYPNIFPSEVSCKGIESTNNNGTLTLSNQTSLIHGYSQTNKLRATFTNWTKMMEEADFINKKYYEIFINNGKSHPTYWLSSRCTQCTENIIFQVKQMVNGSIGGYNMINSTGAFNAGYNCGFRPVITLNEDIQFVNESENTWKIK